MTERSQKLLDEALELPKDERALLARELIASLDGDADPDAEREWAREIQRRAEELERNPEIGRDAAEVFRDIEKKWSGKRDG